MSRGHSRSSSGGSSRGMSRSSFSSSRTNYHRPMHGNVVIIGGGHHGGRGGGFYAGIAFAGFFALIGIILLLFGFMSLGEKQEEYSPTFATAVSNSIDDGWYYTTYDYMVEGIKYRNKSQEGWEFPERVGETVLIYYQVSNPNIITEEEPHQTSPAPFFLIGSILTIFGVIVIVALVKTKKQFSDNPQSSSSNSTLESVPEETKEYCSYCGAQIPEGEHKCPNCGASKNK